MPLDIKDIAATNAMLRTRADKLPAEYKVAYGHEVELLLCWIHQHIAIGTPDLVGLFYKAGKPISKTYSTSAQYVDSVVGELKKLLASFVVKSSKQCVISGLLFCDCKFSDEIIRAAVSLIFGTHPFSHLCTKVTKKHYCINGLDFLNPAEIFSLIDFPITSVQNLLTALCEHYIDSTAFADKGFLVGSTAAGIIVLYGNKFKSTKLIPPAVFPDIYADEMITEKLSLEMQSSLGILEEDHD